MGRTVYLTTPIYYVNAEPHIGHLYTTVLADALKRYHRLVGDDAYFLTGTDEHGEKIARAAEREGLSPQQLVDRISGQFRDTWRAIGIDNDDFIRTTDERHRRYVREVLQQVYDKGDIYFDEYKGLYCVGCERYLTASELVDGKCPDHQVEPREVKEANYFFKMSSYQQRLVEHIEKNPDWIRPERYRNEVLSFLSRPLEDLCISRPKSRLTWGIDLPFDEDFVTYVWFDALLNYPSALRSAADGSDLFDRYWPHANHLIAKDILKTHAIYWPTMLLAAGIPLFDRIDVHGYWLVGESKMSKSLGNAVRPLDFDRRFGIESLRYFFFREMRFGTDASFTYELFVERYNSDLANGLGNLLSRLASLVKKNREGVIPGRQDPPERPGRGWYAGAIERYSEKLVDPELDEFAPLDQVASSDQFFGPSYPQAFERRIFHHAVERIRGQLTNTDWFINEMAPWKLAKSDTEEDQRLLDLVLYTGLEVVRIVAVLLSPILPEKCGQILSYLGERRPLDGGVPFEQLSAWGGLSAGHQLGDVPRLFPRIDEKKLGEVLAGAEAEEKRAARAGSGEAAGREDLEPIRETISFEEFSKVDLRVATIREAGPVKGADKLIRLGVDLGEGRLRQVLAGISAAYPEPEKLVGRQVIVVANLAPRKMRFGVSEGMVLAGCSPDGDRLTLTTFDSDLEPGDTVS
ncbi:MAG: methionine--tRNA ligase [Polyangia bacterium]